MQTHSSTNKSLGQFLIPLGGVLTLTPWVSSWMALALGLVLTLTCGNPYLAQIKNITHRLLAVSIVGLGAGMNLAVIGQVGVQGIGYTIIGIACAALVGTLLGKFLQTEKDTSLLITVGTAICGGSAIAAVAPVINAKHHEVSVSLGIVFMLNATALVLFPWLGHQFMLDQHQFGLWAALAIHDTSSVVGATLQYGPEALATGTTVKLARALWIIPVAIIVGFMRARTQQADVKKQSAKKPWFILGFILAAALVTWVPSLAPFGHEVEAIAKRLMVLTLFLIGSSLNRDAIRSVGVKPFVQGFLLWVVMAGGSLTAVYYGLIH